MGNGMKQILIYILCGYLGAGLFGGLMIKQAIPALNAFGVSYYAVTWPYQVYCARTARQCEGFPDALTPYMFSFGVPSDHI